MTVRAIRSVANAIAMVGVAAVAVVIGRKVSVRKARVQKVSAPSAPRVSVWKASAR